LHPEGDPSLVADFFSAFCSFITTAGLRAGRVMEAGAAAAAGAGAPAADGYAQQVGRWGQSGWCESHADDAAVHTPMTRLCLVLLGSAA
jgi:hypothetical protein